MSEPGRRAGHGGTHDAEGSKEALLNAAEEVFAEHGFDGARIDSIAKVAGYNKSLIFQYYGDKLGLYAEVIRRADREMSGLQGQFMTMLSDIATDSDPEKFKALLVTGLRTYFEFLRAHPRIMRIYNWEMAEGWQTYAKIIIQPEYDDVDQFRTVFQNVQHAGLLRQGLEPVMQLAKVLTLLVAPLMLGLVSCSTTTTFDQSDCDVASVRRRHSYGCQAYPDGGGRPEYERCQPGVPGGLHLLRQF